MQQATEQGSCNRLEDSCARLWQVAKLFVTQQTFNLFHTITVHGIVSFIITNCPKGHAEQVLGLHVAHG